VSGSKRFGDWIGAFASLCQASVKPLSSLCRSLGLEKSWKVSLEDTLIDVKIGSALPKFNLCSKGAPKPTLELQSDFSQSLCRAFAKLLSSLCQTFVRPLSAFVVPLSNVCQAFVDLCQH
jgi:hypothetical protein